MSDIDYNYLCQIAILKTIWVCTEQMSDIDYNYLCQIGILKTI